MGIRYNRYFGRLRLLRFSDVGENPRPRASRRSCHVVYVNIQSLSKNLSDLSLIDRGGEVFFFLF